MKTIHVLLGNSDRRLNNLVEVAARDVCFDHAVVECFRTARLDELIQRGCCENSDLIFIAPTHLVADGKGRKLRNPIAEAATAVTTIKNHRPVPIIAIAVPSEHELRMLMAGADHVFGSTFNDDILRAEIRRLLNLSEPMMTQPLERPSFAAGLMRRLDWFKQAVGG